MGRRPFRNKLQLRMGHDVWVSASTVQPLPLPCSLCPYLATSAPTLQPSLLATSAPTV